MQSSNYGTVYVLSLNGEISSLKPRNKQNTVIISTIMLSVLALNTGAC